MNYVVTYVSHATRNTSEQDIKDLLSQTNEFNNSNKITGVLLHNEGNFFQVLEGEEKLIRGLFNKIKADKRHENLMVIFQNRLERTAYDGYIADFITAEKKIDEKTINQYLSHLRILDAKSQTVVKNIIESFLM